MSDTVMTDYLTIQNEYINQVKTFTVSQYKSKAIQVIKDVCDLAIKNNSDAYLLESHLDLALELLLDLKTAVNDNESVWNKDEKIETFYKDFNWDISRPWLQDPEKVDIIILNEVINKYLSYEWLSSAVFEHALINAYLRYCIELNRNQLIPPSPILSPLTTILGGVLKWVLPVGLFIYALTNGWIITAILSAIYIGSIITSTFIQKKAQNNNLKKLSSVVDLKIYVSGNIWSPKLVMGKIKNLDKFFNIPELPPLLSKISQRNSEIFNLI